MVNVRRNMSEDKRFVAAIAATNRLVKMLHFKNSQNIACYFAQASEFDCAPMIKAIWEAKKNCYLPIISEVDGRTLAFGSYHPDSPLKPNRYGIDEPDTLAYFPLNQLDLVMMPLVGFDLQGHRLGMGGGCYDRSFQFLHDNKSHKPFMLGLAYELQKIEHVPTDPWDIGMDGVLTEDELYLF
jgi:5-formyltetrahydrofolate cyclo-ligase